MATCAPRQLKEEDRKKALGPKAPIAVTPEVPPLVHLQRTIGNRAVIQTLNTPPAMRGLTVRASDLDKAFGLGAIGSNLGRGTYAAIRRTLAAYERHHNPADRAEYLHTLGALISKWMVEHRGRGAADTERRTVLQKLEGEITAEQVAFGKDRSDATYLGNVQSAVGGDDDVHALKALTSQTKGELDDRSKKARERDANASALGLTEAEIAAIKIFTSAGADYGYINPATANSDVWYDKAQKSERTAPGFKSEASHEERKAEGRLHAAMAIKGLSKLPKYGPDVYRGLGLKRVDFMRHFKAGGTYKVPSLGSASVERTVAEKYAATSGEAIGVLLVIHGSGGRDISSFSTVKAEKEVTLLPIEFKIQSIKEVPKFASTAKIVADAEGGRRDSVRFYEVHVTG